LSIVALDEGLMVTAEAVTAETVYFGLLLNYQGF